MRITSTEIFYHKEEWFTDNLGAPFIQSIRDILTTVNFVNPPAAVQAKLSNEIINALVISDDIVISTDPVDIKCHPILGYKHDGVVTKEDKRIGLEVQFRPDFLKDITRFQLGFHSNRIQAVIYIVANDRNTINAGYTSMPGFNLIRRQLNHFGDWLLVPIVVIGINGDAA